MNETMLRFLTVINIIFFIIAISILGVVWWKYDVVLRQAQQKDTSLIPSSQGPSYPQVQELFKGFSEYYNSLPEKRRECIQKNVLSEERLSQLLKDSPPLGSVSLTEEETLQMQNCIRQYK